MRDNGPILWAKTTLHQQGYIVLGEPEMVRDMPWSQVLKFHTSTDTIFLKISAAAFSNEANLLQFLNHLGFNAIPKVIAKSDQNNCFLMKDSGQTLRNKLKKEYDIQSAIQTLEIYSAMQIQCIAQVKNILELGVNDWRLENLPSLYNRFIEDKVILQDEGLSELDMQALRDFYPLFVSLCEKLSTFNIPETLEHGDFQDNNILIKNNKIIIHDFGDASIAHPFFSLASFLDSAARHHGIAENDDRYARLFDAYMTPWYPTFPQETCLSAFKLAQRINHFVFALSFSRIKSCPGIENFPEYKGYISKALKQLLGSTD